MVGRVSVLISTYGNPWRRYPPQGDQDYLWRDVEYRLGSESMLGRTTLPLLYRKHSPDRVLIVVLDTVIHRDDLKDYKDLVKSVEDLYRGFASQSLASLCGGKCDDIGKRLRIIVAPGIGSFPWIGRGREVVVEICGNPGDFYAYVFSSLALELLKLLKEVREVARGGMDLEVILDLSHGINYMPVLTHRAVRDIMSIMSLAAFIRSARLTVYNTDPVIPIARDTIQRISVNVIEETVFKETGGEGTRVYIQPSLQAISTLKLLALNEKCVEEEERGQMGRGIGKDMDRLRDKYFSHYLEEFEKGRVGIEDKLSAFAGSIANGLPLVTLYTVPQIDMQPLYEEIFDVYRKYIEIRSSGQTLSIRRKARIREDLVALFKILALSEIIRMSIDIETQIREPTLRDLLELKDKIFSTNDKMEAIIGSELGRLKEAIVRAHGKECRDICEESWLSLRCVVEGETQATKAGPDKRNFLAHSGLERNVTCYRYDADAPSPDDSIRLRYVEEHISSIYKLSQSGLLKI